MVSLSDSAAHAESPPLKNVSPGLGVESELVRLPGMGMATLSYLVQSN